MGSMDGVIVLERRDALLFRRFEEVALVMDEYAGRVTVVMADGEVAWRPGPASEVPCGGLVEILPGIFANPRHGRREGGAMEFPGGWSFPDVPPFVAPPAAAPAQDPMVGCGTGRRVRSSAVVYVQVRGGYVVRCEGESLELEERPRELLAGHPWLVKMGSSFVNVRRMREIRLQDDDFELCFDTGDAVKITPYSSVRAAKRLGLTDLRSAGVKSAAAQLLYDEGLRDWPRPLLEMPLEVTKPLLGSDRHMAIANALWQVVRMGAAGKRPDYGTDIRGFWYLPLLPILNGLNLLDDVPASALDLLACSDGLLEGGGAMELFGVHDAIYHEYEVVLGDLIGRGRLFTYRDLGFEDPRPDLRGLGAARPQVVLAVEKFSLLVAAREVAARFGISYMVMGGDPSWIGVEFFAEALRSVLPPGRKVDVVSYGDFDPSGWRIADSLIMHLERYGIGTESVRRLVLPRRFTADEISRRAYTLEERTERQRTIVREWIARSGGVDGRPLGIHADHLRPVERIIAAFREETGLEEVGR